MIGLILVTALVVAIELIAVTALVVPSELIVVSGLAPRWAAKQPQKQALRFVLKTPVSGLGPLRSPARGKPAHHRHHRSPASTTSTIALFPAMRPRVQRRQHQQGQQRDRAYFGHRTCCGERAYCGERACPALGCEAAPKTGAAVCLKNPGSRIRAASQPSAGQARSPQTPQKPRFNYFNHCPLPCNAPTGTTPATPARSAT
ncbi:hypothetical protein ACVWXD_004183 [Pseudomonas sp. TE3911]